MKAKALAVGWLTVWFGGSLLWSLFGSAPELVLSRALSGPQLPTLLAGADTYGRDLLHVLSQASLLSLFFALACVSLSAMVAITTASLAPNLTHQISKLLESILQLLLAFPSLLLAMMLAGFLGPGRLTVAAALILGSAPGLTRVLWARSREIHEQEFVWAARSLGAAPLHIARTHFIPHLASLARVKIPSMLAQAIMAEASLSFLGLGFPVGQETWGSLLAQARDYLIEAPHISIVVGTPLVLTLLALDAVSKPTTDELI